MTSPLPSKIGSGSGPQGKGKTVVRVPTSPSFTNIDGRQGPIGMQGSAGAQGDPGSGGETNAYTGRIGNQGYQGYQGFQGFQGEGEQGPIGFIGVAGSAGNQGSQGGQGWQGAISTAGTGFQGPQGRGGGIQGSQGNQGLNWLGFQGFQAEAGVQGQQGTQGYGIQGFTGRTSNMGVQGWQGRTSQSPQGSQGSQGPQAQLPGTVGVQGNQGLTGIYGRVNTRGVQGSQGRQGELAGTTSIFYEDFISNAQLGLFRTFGTLSLVTGAAYGVVKLTASASNTSYLARGPSPVLPTDGLINKDTYPSEFRINLAVYGASMSGMWVIVGLINPVSPVVTTGAYFLAGEGINGGKWQCLTKQYAGSTVVHNSTIDPQYTDGTTFTFQELKIVRTDTEYEFYIDQALEFSIAYNFPDRNMFPTILISNLNLSGTKSCYSDFFFIESKKE